MTNLQRREAILDRIDGCKSALEELMHEERRCGPNREIDLRRDMIKRGLEKWRRQLSEVVNGRHHAT